MSSSALDRHPLLRGLRFAARLGALALVAGPLAAAGVATPSVHHLAARTAAPDPSVALGLDDHSIRLPGLGDDFAFVAGGDLYEYDNGTARLIGIIARASDPDERFALDMRFGDRRRPRDGNQRPRQSPNRGLQASAYVDAGGPVDPATWRYYAQMNGTLTGLDSLHGAVFELRRTGPMLQIGMGANNRNLALGASTGFSGTLARQPETISLLPLTVLDADLCLELGGSRHHSSIGAQADPSWSRFRGHHALSLEGLGHFVFVSGGQLVDLPDGNAKLTGLVVKLREPSQQFFVDVDFRRRVNPGDGVHPPIESPKLTLRNGSYKEDGVVDPDTWYYYLETNGTLTGQEAFAGLNLRLERAGPAFQVGLGANGVNLDYGASGWLRVHSAEDQLAGQGQESDTGKGDLILSLRGESQDCVDRALVQQGLGPYSGGHAVWLPGIGTDFVLVSDGQLVELPNGTARLTGVVASSAAPDRKLMVDVELRGRIDPGAPTYPPAGSPKRELNASAYVENGGPVATSAWRYYTEIDGVLTGLEAFAGGRLHVGRRGPAFQVGLGANGKNTNFGGSGWLDALVLAQPDSIVWPAQVHGDINIDVGGDCPECPETALGDATLGVSSDGDTAFWLPGIGTDFDFEPGARFVERREGTALLVGTLARRGNPNARLAVHVELAQRVNPGGFGFVPEGSPKRELPASAYVENGGPLDTNAWRYYLELGGTLTGLDDLAGALYRVERRGPPPQLGLGASGRNLRFGTSSWITVEALNFPEHDAGLPKTVHGDINLDLTRNCP